MKAKTSGALSLLAFVVLLKNPQVHDALNGMLDSSVRSVGAWFRAVSQRRRVESKGTAEESETEYLQEKRPAKRKATVGSDRGSSAKSTRGKVRRLKKARVE